MENTTSTMREQQGKLTLIDSFITAMFSPKEYGKLLGLGTGRIVGYIAVLLLMVSVIQYAIPVLGAIAGMGGVRNIIINEVPEFSLKNGEFYYEDKIERTDDITGMYVVIDTDADEFTTGDIPDRNIQQAVLVSKSNMIVYNSIYGLSGIVDERRFADFTGITFSNETIADMSGIIYLMLFFIFLAMCFVVLIEFLGATLLYATLMYFLVKHMADVTYGTVFKVTIFAQTIGTLVEAVCCAIGTELFVMGGSLFNIIVTVIIMNMVITQFPKKEYL